MNADEYEALVERLAGDVVATLCEDGLSGEPDGEEILWSAVGSFVPRMEATVCESILSLGGSDPLDDLVEEVVAVRDSDGDERLRAEAFTVLLQDVDGRVAARGGYGSPD